MMLVASSPQSEGIQDPAADSTVASTPASAASTAGRARGAVLRIGAGRSVVTDRSAPSSRISVCGQSIPALPRNVQESDGPTVGDIHGSADLSEDALGQQVADQGAHRQAAGAEAGVDVDPRPVLDGAGRREVAVRERAQP